MTTTVPKLVFQYLWSAHFAVLLWIIILLLLFVYLHRAGAIPQMSSFQAFTTQIDSRGGNIVVLAFFTSWCLVEVHWGRMPQNFWTGTVFGAFAGALLKTMTGGGSAARGGDITANGGTVTATSKTTTATEVTKTDPAPVTPATPTTPTTPATGG